MSQIIFKKQCTAQGRNGVSKCVGVDLYPTTRIDDNNQKFHIVSISPINSKGDVTNCWIEIEMDKIPDIIKDLQFFYDGYIDANSKLQRQPCNQSE